MSKTNYLSNNNLLIYIQQSKEQNKITNELSRALMLLVERYSKKSNWVNYTYLEDMKGDAIIALVKAWYKFDETRSQNPFAFFTQVAKNAFLQHLNKEKLHRDIRDALLVQVGLDPSFSYQEKDNEKHNIQTLSDYDRNTTTD